GVLRRRLHVEHAVLARVLQERREYAVLRAADAREHPADLDARPDVGTNEIRRRLEYFLVEELHRFDLTSARERHVDRPRLATRLVLHRRAADDGRHVSGLRRPLTNGTIVQFLHQLVVFHRSRSRGDDVAHHALDVLEAEPGGLHRIRVTNRLAL